MSNVLDLVDQAFFLSERATGFTNVLQCVWVYDRPIDIDGLRRFHHQLQRGPLSRRIERSPLPFGRHRWVAPADVSDLEIIEKSRPREEFDAWLSEQAHTPLDAEHGPGWHLAVLPFTDGGAGVSLVASHCLSDGVGLCEALADAAGGDDNAIDWPAAGSRRRWQAVREDARQTIRDIPTIRRAAVASVRVARHSDGNAGPAGPAPVPPARVDEKVMLSTATIFLDAAEWDDRAESLGGTGNTLLAGLAARLAQRAGRVTADGTVTVGMPVYERTADDSRANAVTNVDFTVDPGPAAEDLRGIRAATKQALTRFQVEPDERLGLLPLIPLVPEWLVRRMIGVAASGTATRVVSSNLGVVDPASYRPDGTTADQFAIKASDPIVTAGMMHRTGGILALLSGRVGRQVFVSVLAYQPGRFNSNDLLRHALSSVLNEFSLSATIGWRCPDLTNITT